MKRRSLDLPAPRNRSSGFARDDKVGWLGGTAEAVPFHGGSEQQRT